MRLALGLAVFAVFASPAETLRAADVDLEVVLAADVSRSIDDGEFELQRKGYAAALTDPRVLRAIAAGPHHAIAVSFVEFSGDSDQRVVVPWTALRDEEGAGSVAATLLKAPRSFMGRTSISRAIDFAVTQLAAAKWRASRRVIDISGDGTSNSGPELEKARNGAIALGITINGLAIINDRPDMSFSVHTHPPGGLPHYFREEVIGGPGAFLVVVKDFNSFADALANKLAKEINIAEERGRRHADY
ncbi:MAG TPA: DUF1194 domain-containing protein [Stellaceae bacterium]|nr:DUF1194 domain-containing protein [Stellaceae bacterium]